MSNKSTAPKSTAPAVTYVPTPDALAAGKSMHAALALESRAYGAKGAAALAILTATGAVADGKWQPTAAASLPSFERIAIAVLPQTGRRGRTLWVAPVGKPARDAMASDRTPYGDWWREVGATAKALERAANDAGRKSTRAASQSGKGKGKSVPTPTPDATPAPVAAPVLRDTVAAVLSGRPVSGLSEADASAIRTDAAAILAPASGDATPEDIAGALRLMVDAGYDSPVVLAACRAYVARFGKVQRTRRAATAAAAQA